MIGMYLHMNVLDKYCVGMLLDWISSYNVIFNSSTPSDKMATILADDIFKCLFANRNDKIPILIPLMFVPTSPIDNKPASAPWTNVDQVHCCVYAALGGDELNYGALYSSCYRNSVQLASPSMYFLHIQCTGPLAWVPTIYKAICPVLDLRLKTLIIAFLHVNKTSLHTCYDYLYQTLDLVWRSQVLSGSRLSTLDFSFFHYTKKRAQAIRLRWIPAHTMAVAYSKSRWTYIVHWRTLIICYHVWR